jgi:hypothetical protein
MDYSQLLADYIRRLMLRGSFVIQTDAAHTEHMCADHIGIDLADAVLQRRADWYSTVKPRLDRIRREYPLSQTMSGLKAVLGSVSASEFLKWPESKKNGGWCRVKVFLNLVELLDRERVDTEDDLRAWLAHDHNRAKLRAIHQVSDKTIDYLKIRVGLSAVAVDKHVTDFLEEAGIPSSRMDYAQKESIVAGAAKLLALAPEILDCSIWYYRAKPKGLCPEVA